MNFDSLDHEADVVWLAVQVEVFSENLVKRSFLDKNRQRSYKSMIIDDYLVPIQKHDNDVYKLPLELE